MVTQEDIIRMAVESVALSPVDSALFHPQSIKAIAPFLERFTALVAVLVAEQEREACAKVVDHILKEGGGTYGDAIRRRGEVS